MQITPNRASQYRVTPQTKPPVPVRFGGNEDEDSLYAPALKLMEDAIDKNVKLAVTVDGDEMTPQSQAKALKERAQFFSDLAERLKIRSQKAIESAANFDASLRSTSTGTATSNKAQEAEGPKETSAKPAEVPSNQQGEQENAPAADSNTAKPKWTPRNERTRWSVAKDVTRQYFTGGKVLWDLGLGVAVGALFAIGSPVMAVTIPTAWAVYGGWRLIQLAWKMGHDPKGDKIDAMYKKW